MEVQQPLVLVVTEELVVMVALVEHLQSITLQLKELVVVVAQEDNL